MSCYPFGSFGKKVSCIPVGLVQTGVDLVSAFEMIGLQDRLPALQVHMLSSPQQNQTFGEKYAQEIPIYRRLYIGPRRYLYLDQLR